MKEMAYSFFERSNQTMTSSFCFHTRDWSCPWMFLDVKSSNRSENAKITWKLLLYLSIQLNFSMQVTTNERLKDYWLHLAYRVSSFCLNFCIFKSINFNLFRLLLQVAATSSNKPFLSFVTFPTWKMAILIKVTTKFLWYSHYQSIIERERTNPATNCLDGGKIEKSSAFYFFVTSTFHFFSSFIFSLQYFFFPSFFLRYSFFLQFLWFDHVNVYLFLQLLFAHTLHARTTLHLHQCD